MGTARWRPPIKLRAVRAVGAAVRGNALRSAVHGAGDGTTKSNRGERNGGADDRENKRILGGRSTRVIAQHVDESLHVTIPSLKAPAPLPECGLNSLRVDRRNETKT